MKKYCHICKLILLIVLVSEYSYLQAQFWLRKGTGIQQSEAHGVSVDVSGNSYTTGFFFNSITFGPLSATASGLTDIYVVKTDSTGNFQWLVTAGGSGLDKGYSIKADNFGNVYVTGVFTGNASFGSTIITSNNSSQDIFLAKYNSSGVFQWVKQAGGASGDASNSVTTDLSGNVFITGFFEGEALFESTTLTSAIHPVTLQYTADVFTAKYDASGNLIWVEQGTTTEYATGVDLATDATGNVYVTGHFSGNITFDVLHPNNSFNSIFIVKYNSAGDEQWFKMLGAGTTNTVSGIASDNFSNIYLTGNFTGGTIIFDSPNITLTNTYPERIFLVKFNSAGNVIWAKTVGSVSPVSVKNIAVDNLNNPYLIGNFECKFSEYADQYGQGTFNSVGFKDVFVAKYDTSGSWQWSRQFGGQKNDAGNGISFDPNNHAVICGNFVSTINFPVNPANFYAPIGDFTPPSINQNITYCGDANYGSFAALQGNGLIDIFIAKPIDLSREPYDYYKRSGSGCNRDVGNICISLDDSICAPDTIIINTCDIQYELDLFSLSNNAPGPNYNYFWTWPPFVSNGSEITLEDFTGSVSLTMTSEDGCYTNAENVYVITNVLPHPPIPSISNNLGLNSDSMIVCPPDTQIILTGTNTGAYYYWLGYDPGLSPISITVTQSSELFFYVGSTDSCEVFKKVKVIFGPQLDSLVPAVVSPDTVKGCPGDVFVTWFAFNTLGPDTFCIFPPATTTWTVNLPVIWEPPTCTSDGVFQATQTGLHQIDGTIIRNNQCGDVDTHYVSTNIYVEIYPNPPPFSVSITGDLLFCPSSSTTLTANGPPGTTYEWYNLFNGTLIGTSSTISVSQPGDYYLIGTFTNSYGCSKTASDFKIVNVKPAPQIQLDPPSGVVCPGGGTVQLTVPASTGTWQWFGPSGSIGGNVNNITVSIPGNYFCIYTDADSCEFILNSIEVQQYSTPYLSAGPSNVLCPGTTVTIEVITNSGSSVQWLPPLSGTDPVQIITQPGTYTAMITSCGIQTIDSVTISGSNVEAVINPSGIISLCLGDSLLLTANPGMATYTWMPGNINSQNLMINQSGLYELTTTDAGGCSASASVEVFTYLLDPPVALEDTVCRDSSAVLTGYYFGDGVLSWYDAPNGNLLDTGWVFTTPPLQSNTTFYMQVFDSVCVSNFEPVNVFIHTSPSAPLIYSNSPLCSGDTILLSTSFSAPGAVYYWSGPGNFSSGLQNPFIVNASVANSGIYELVVTDDECPSEPAEINISVVTVPGTPTIYANGPYCESDTIIISTDLIAGLNYSWTGPNNFTSSAQQVVLTNVNLNHAGNYYLSVFLGNCKSDTASAYINVKESPVAVNPISNSPLCIGDTLSFNSTFVSGYNYYWTGPNNFNSNNSTEIIYPAEFNNAGNYILTVELNGCTGSPEIISVQINDLPYFTLGDDKTACSGEIFNAQPDQQFAGYLWNTGYTGIELNITQTGTYYLTVTDASGCRYSDSLFINFIDCFTEIPNIFTPNNDGFNDVFSINSDGMIELNCKIFNRWGELIYEFNGLNESWDGTNKTSGKLCPDGVYFYIANSTDFSAIQKQFSGFIHLVRNK